MDEISFINAVLDEADCKLLLDVNNIYVNSVNHRYDASDFLRALPGERIAYVHIAGHYNEAEDLIVDTHGADVIDPVWDLLEEAYEQFGVLPTLLERDFNIPPFKELMTEVSQIKEYQIKHKEFRLIARQAMSQPELLKKQLFDFAAHIRDPENSPVPDNIEDRRMEIYRGLFFNNVQGFLANTFPVLKSLYEEDAWIELVRSFYSLPSLPVTVFSRNIS